MALTWDDVVLVDPALSEVPAAVQNRILVEVGLRVPDGRWSDDMRPIAQAYLAAHLGTLYSRGGSAAGGQVVSETVGPVSRTFSSGGSDSADDWDSTPWGTAYRRLVRENISTRCLVV